MGLSVAQKGSLWSIFIHFLTLSYLGVVPKEEDFRLPFLSHQQLPAGILPMVPEVAQAVGASQGPHTKDYGRPNQAKTSLTATIANELLYAGTSPTAEGILKGSKNLSPRNHGPLTRPSEQLGYLATVQGLQVLGKHKHLCIHTDSNKNFLKNDTLFIHYR